MLRYLVNKIQRGLILALGGYDPVKVRNLLYRANLLGDQIANYGCDSSNRDYIVIGQVRAVRRSTIELDPIYARTKGYTTEGDGRKRDISELEVIYRGKEGVVTRLPDSNPHKARLRGLLVENPGSSGGVPVDSKRVGVEGDTEGAEVPWERLVQHMVSPDCT